MCLVWWVEQGHRPHLCSLQHVCIGPAPSATLGMLLALRPWVREYVGRQAISNGCLTSVPVLPPCLLCLVFFCACLVQEGRGEEHPGLRGEASCGAAADGAGAAPAGYQGGWAGWLAGWGITLALALVLAPAGGLLLPHMSHHMAASTTSQVHGLGKAAW